MTTDTPIDQWRRPRQSERRGALVSNRGRRTRHHAPDDRPRRVGSHLYNFEHTIGLQLEQFTTVLYLLYTARLRPIGSSARPVHVYIEMLAADLDGLRQALGLAQINVLGFSFGGNWR